MRAALQEGSESGLGASLALIASMEEAEVLRDLATFAAEVARDKPHAMAYGPRMMIAGAAAARAALVESSDEATLADQALLSQLNSLQASIDQGQLDLAAALQKFAPLGAQLCRVPRRPFLDLEVESKNDDAVLLWSSGAAALVP